jgi:hypothetical protein
MTRGHQRWIAGLAAVLPLAGAAVLIGELRQPVDGSPDGVDLLADGWDRESCCGEDMQPICFASRGRDISSRAVRDPAKSIRYCRKGGERHIGWCYFGVAKALIDWGSDPRAGMAMCRRLGEVPGWEQCYQGVGEQVANLIVDRDQRIRICEEAPRPEAVKVCRLSAATLPPETIRTDTLKS